MLVATSETFRAPLSVVSSSKSTECHHERVRYKMAVDIDSEVPLTIKSGAGNLSSSITGTTPGVGPVQSERKYSAGRDHSSLLISTYY
jgi:hypothetical protein